MADSKSQPWIVTAAQIDGFEDEIRQVIYNSFMLGNYKPAWNYVSKRDKAIRIGFDAAWKPFLCPSHGKTEEGLRVYLNPSIGFLPHLVRVCIDYNRHNMIDINGGRFFLSVEGVWKKVSPGRRDMVAEWTLTKPFKCLNRQVV